MGLASAGVPPEVLAERDEALREMRETNEVRPQPLSDDSKLQQVQVQPLEMLCATTPLVCKCHVLLRMMAAEAEALKPRRPFEKERLDAELKLVGEYGLRNKRELWRVQVVLSKIRNAARTLLTLDEKDPKRIFEGQALMRRLYKYGLLNETQDKLDYALALQPNDFLERRLQTLVFKQGLAKSIHHARVLIRQKHIRQVARSLAAAVLADDAELLAVPEDPDFDIVDRDEAGQPDLAEAQRKRKASGEARAARSRNNTFHARKVKLAHLVDHLPQALWDAFLDDAVQPRVEAISERGVIGLPPDQLDAQGQPLSYTDTNIPVSAADIPNLSCRNLYLQLCRGLPGEGENTQPNAAVAAVLAAHPDLCARLEAIPRHLSDTNMVDQVGKQLETAFSNILILLFAGRLKKSVSGAKVLLGTNEHQRRFGVRGLVGGHLPAWSKRQCTYMRRMVCGLEVTWLVGEGGVVVTAAMQAEVALQWGLLGLGEGEKVDDDWVEDPANRGRLLRHAVHTTKVKVWVKVKLVRAPGPAHHLAVGPQHRISTPASPGANASSAKEHQQLLGTPITCVLSRVAACSSELLASMPYPHAILMNN
ncbi:hypothetical protein QJQ45_015419 [Haematococcus lacustris]|nr:hypothetical protein QJQ45_015419 [Haematococcus lacustris]